MNDPTVLLRREPLRSTIIDKAREELAEKAESELAYSYLSASLKKQQRPIAEILIYLDVQPYTAESVVDFKIAVEPERSFLEKRPELLDALEEQLPMLFLRSLVLACLCLIVCLALTLVYGFGSAFAVSGLMLLGLMIVVLASLFVFGAVSSAQQKNRLRWNRIELGKYNKPVPELVLQPLLAI